MLRSRWHQSDHGIEERMCWICLNTDEEMRVPSTWLQPCLCRGTNKWVHEACLSRWIDEKQQLNPDVSVSCPQCHTEYIIVMPPICRFDAILERVEKTYGLLCPSVLMGMLATVFYIATLSYGALTMHQIAGYERSLQLMKDDPTLLMIVLPSVPAGLLLLRRLEWDSWLVRWLRRRQRQPMAREHLDEHGEPLPGAPLDDEYFDGMEPIDDGDVMQGGTLNTENVERATCRFCTILSLPTFSVLIGQTLYSNLNSRMLSILLGAITFEVVKGLIWVYMRQCKYYRRRYRSVLNYTAENVELTGRSI
ncbi:E3 ubiquitin-protein ligase MARCHF5 [Drosophila sulfurigaster albostrigata]|uniref:E3 ubiquitin-protein ligase MARCHF5 n=1 Tax=Drosophila sulfurigaster albostrigata TaxID=89887 RepID=UPI002D2186F9|nr:E3 ubiquitin-protein ligase MARCHF5 [Drosophila sulfurigaster albostrigata]